MVATRKGKMNVTLKTARMMKLIKPDFSALKFLNHVVTAKMKE